MDLEVSEDADIEKLLELRVKLMDQLQRTEQNTVAAKSNCHFRGQKRLHAECDDTKASRLKRLKPNWKRSQNCSSQLLEKIDGNNDTDDNDDDGDIVVVEEEQEGKKGRGRSKEIGSNSNIVDDDEEDVSGCNNGSAGLTNDRSCSSFSTDTNNSAASKEPDELLSSADENPSVTNLGVDEQSSFNETVHSGSTVEPNGPKNETVNYEQSCSAVERNTPTASCSAQKMKYGEELIPAPPPPPILDVGISKGNCAEIVNDVANDTEMKSSDAVECLSKNEGGEGNVDYDCDFLSSEDEEAIDSLLERPFEDGQTGKVPLPEEGEKREKVVLAHRDTDYFDVLPEGWVEVTHSSGLPIYLHKSSRVCTFSRPYFIGPGSVRHHAVPESAIPCLHQRRVLKEVEERAKESEAALEEALKTSARNPEGGDNEELAKLAIARLQAPGTKVQSAEDFKQRQLDPQALHEYAKKVFRFKTIQIYRFNKWSATRSFHRQKKMAEAERLGKLAPAIEVPTGRPTLPLHVQLITVPALENNQKPHHKGFFLNPHGKTSVSILHEYVQKVLKSTISYEFEETRNSSTPYACCARLKINLNNRVMSAATIKEKLLLLQEKEKRGQELQNSGENAEEDFVVLGRGCGNSKKAAKLDAAKSALKVLIPAIEFDSEGIARTQKKESEDAKCEEGDAVALFDMLPIEDSRIPDLSARAGQPSPYLILQECLKRNAVHGDTEIKLRSERVKHQKHKFDMDVGKHKVSVICSNKREGKQMASQAMLKKLHPQFDNWGSLIRLYGQETQQKHQEARRCRQSIIKLQGSRDKDSSSFEPNKAILEKLRVEMLNVLKSKRHRENMKVRPPLSYSGEPLDADDVAKNSGEYAKNHQDTQSTFKIDF